MGRYRRLRFLERKRLAEQGNLTLDEEEFGGMRIQRGGFVAEMRALKTGKEASSFAYGSNQHHLLQND